MAEPGYSVLRNNIQAANGNSPPSTYPTSGFPIMTVMPAVGVGSPLASAVVSLEFNPDATNHCSLDFDYSMSSSDGAGTVGYSLTVIQVALGADPNLATPVVSTGTFTPGAGTVYKRLDSSVIAALELTLARDQITYVIFSRPIGAPGSHAGDLNIIGWKLRPL